ncbi:MAG: hypothetical protein IID49_10665 [Proteobacteria bacterium]|nr:hypothetical protein [Pseudomonadota bacterium]
MQVEKMRVQLSEALVSGVDLTMINDDYPLLKNLLDEILEIEITNNTNMPLRPEYRSTVADSGEKATFGSSATADQFEEHTPVRRLIRPFYFAQMFLRLSFVGIVLHENVPAKSQTDPKGLVAGRSRTTASPQSVILDGARSHSPLRFFFAKASKESILRSFSEADRSLSSSDFATTKKGVRPQLIPSIGANAAVIAISSSPINDSVLGDETWLGYFKKELVSSSPLKREKARERIKNAIPGSDLTLIRDHREHYPRIYELVFGNTDRPLPPDQPAMVGLEENATIYRRPPVSYPLFRIILPNIPRLVLPVGISTMISVDYFSRRLMNLWNYFGRLFREFFEEARPMFRFAIP